MALMSTCVARLGSRFSMILDPIRKEVHYGSLGLLCQSVGQIAAGVDDGKTFCTFPLSRKGTPFYNCDQVMTPTSVLFEGRSLEHGLEAQMEIAAPFWPRDFRTSSVPAYVITFRLKPVNKTRWESSKVKQGRSGKLRFAIEIPGVKAATSKGKAKLSYDVQCAARWTTAEGSEGQQIEFGPRDRTTPGDGKATDYILPLTGDWKVRKGQLEAAYDVDDGEQEFSLALVSYMGDPLFERLHEPMPLKYTTVWKSADEVCEWVFHNHKKLLKKSRDFDELFAESGLPKTAQDLTATSFQSYLMCTLWAKKGRKEHFSVWEGSCWYNSTVDVTFQESMFYFQLWPELLELIFEEWSHHANDYEGEIARREIVSDDDQHGNPLVKFPGRIMEHDMGAGWTCNGQSYHHAMPVEENSNFLVLLYAHGKWWGREKLFKTYNQLNKDLADYLLWTDSTGNGFPDRGTANTIDDATPAVQYGRDNVYLGVKRLAALHAAAKMFREVGETGYARKCSAEVNKAVKTLNAGWLKDHWGVCLDKSAKGLFDCWTGEPLPYKTLPGWDAYSLYTTNGLVPLMLIDDLPKGLDAERLRLDVINACRESMTRYGCGHSSLDTENMWVSMNVWRDIAAGYMGEDLLANSERYWGQQLFANTAGSEKPNCFTETSLTNNLVWYPRNAAMFGLVASAARLTLDRSKKTARVDPIAPGTWPVLPLADWAKGKVPMAQVSRDGKGKLKTELSSKPRGVKLSVKGQRS